MSVKYHVEIRLNVQKPIFLCLYLKVHPWFFTKRGYYCWAFFVQTFNKLNHNLMMRRLLTTSLAFFLIVALFSCSKSDVAATSPIDLLTNGSSKSWLIINAKTNGTKDFASCEDDDVITFTKSTLKALNEVGAKKCSTSDVNTTSTFQLSEDGKILTLDGFGFTVVKLTATELELKITVFGSTSESFFKAK